MNAPFKLHFRPPSRTNSVTILVFGVVLLVLGICGIGYWRYVETQTLHLQERNFRALVVTGQSLAGMVANYGIAFKSVIEGEPPCRKKDGLRCPDKAARKKAYENAVQALPGLQDVTVTEETADPDGFAVKFVKHNGVSSIKLTCVGQDRTKTGTRWQIKAVIDIGPIMRQLVTEDIFSDVLLADRMGRILYHHQSTRDPSGFAFADVSTLLRRVNGLESKDNGAEKGGTERQDDLASMLPLFNEAPIGGISHTIFAQAMDLLADRKTAQILILVGIVPAGQFHAEARAIPLNHLLLVAGLLLTVFFVLPYIKLRTNVPTERLTPISVTVLIISTLLGTALLTFGLADIATYHNLEQHLNRQLEAVSKEIRKSFEDNVRSGLQQLDAFDESCNSNLDCRRSLSSEPSKPDRPKHHLAQRLCIGANGSDNELRFSFFPTTSDRCSEDKSKNGHTQVVYPDVKTMFWVGSNGELKVLRSREPYPWKYAQLQERQYVRRILADEAFVREHGGKRFWIEPIFSRTTGENAAVFSMKSTASSDEAIVAALEVKLPSVTGVGVPPGMGFAVIDQEGMVLFHSDPRRNLRENLFEETDREVRLRQAVFARATTRLDGRYWGKDRHFHIAPLFRRAEISESPDVHWSLVTYWDTDMLRVLNLRALYSSGTLFFIYAIIALSIGILGWWIYARVNEVAYRWAWPQPEDLHPHRLAIVLLITSLIAVGIWYVRPHSPPDMLLWGLLPALVAAVVLSITHPKADPTDHNRTNLSLRRRHPQSHALLMMAGLLTFVVIPALVIFRVAVDVEWRLLAKFVQFDLVRDRTIQAQEIRKSYPPTLFQVTKDTGDIRTKFLQRLPDLNRVQRFPDLNGVHANFPFKTRWLEGPKRDSSSGNTARRGDERLIRWLYHIIERPRLGHRGDETGMFLETPEQWHEPEWGTLWHEDRSQATTSPIYLESQFPPTIPQWLYSLLIPGGLVPLVALRVKKIYAFAGSLGVLGGFLWFGLVGGALAVLGVIALLYGAWYVLPRFAVRRVLLLDFPHPSMGSAVPDEGKEGVDRDPDDKTPTSWPSGLSDVFVKEMSGLRNALRLTGITWPGDLTKFRQKILKQDIEDEFDVVKERIIREFLEGAANQYQQMWENCTESQRRSLFNLARDGFLHSRNPDIGPLLKSGLIVADLNLRPMNKSFRRFVITMGLKERLDEDLAQARTSTWFRVWRPIGAGLLLVMVFLVLTQEQYRAITLAFLGVLPGLLGVFSQALTSAKKEKLETSSSA